MKKTVYYCDRCGKEIDSFDVFYMNCSSSLNKGVYGSVKQHELCEDCFRFIDDRIEYEIGHSEQMEDKKFEKTYI